MIAAARAAQIDNGALEIGNGEGKNENADEKSRRNDGLADGENERRGEDHQKARQAVAPARRQARHRRPQQDHQRDGGASDLVGIGAQFGMVGDRHRQDRQHRQDESDREQIKFGGPHMVPRTGERDDHQQRGSR